MTAQEQSQTNKNLTNSRLRVAVCMDNVYTDIQWWFFHLFVTQAHEKTHTAFFCTCTSNSGSHSSISKISPQGHQAVLAQLCTYCGHTGQPCSLTEGCSEQPWHSGLVACPLHAYSTVATCVRCGTSAQQLEVQGRCLPSSFCDSTGFLGGRRYIWMRDSPAFGWDVAHTETVADFSCYASVENKHSLLKSCLNL